MSIETNDVIDCESLSTSLHICDNQPVSKTKFLGRCVAAIVLYLFYWGTIQASIFQSVSYVLSYNEAKEMVEDGILDSIDDYGFGNHYIWYLISFCATTYLSAYLAGAISRKRGSIIAFLANVPILLVTLWITYVFFRDIKFSENPIGWGIVLPLSIIGGIFCVLEGGSVGEQEHKNNDDENKILGIHLYHWFWIWLFSGPYLMGIASSFIRIETLIFSSGIIYVYLLSFLLLIPLIGYFIPVIGMYQILKGEILSESKKYVKALSFVGIYIGGILLGVTVELVCLAVLKFICKLFT